MLFVISIKHMSYRDRFWGIVFTALKTASWGGSMVSTGRGSSCIKAYCLQGKEHK